MPNVWRQFRCTFTHLPIVKPCYDNQRVSLHAYVNKLLLCRCKVICAAIHSLQLSAACECPCMKKSCNTLSAFLRCKSCKVNPFLAHCPALGWTLSETIWVVNFKHDSVFEHSFHIYLHIIIFLLCWFTEKFYLWTGIATAACVSVASSALHRDVTVLVCKKIQLDYVCESWLTLQVCESCMTLQPVWRSGFLAFHRSGCHPGKIREIQRSSSLAGELGLAHSPGGRID